MNLNVFIDIDVSVVIELVVGFVGLIRVGRCCVGLFCNAL
jgi:hypothetical protein